MRTNADQIGQRKIDLCRLGLLHSLDASPQGTVRSSRRVCVELMTFWLAQCTSLSLRMTPPAKGVRTDENGVPSRDVRQEITGAVAFTQQPVLAPPIAKPPIHLRQRRPTSLSGTPRSLQHANLYRRVLPDGVHRARCWTQTSRPRILAASSALSNNGIPDADARSNHG